MAGALREVLARFGFQIDDKKLDKADAKVNNLVGAMKGAVAIFAAGQMVNFAKDFVSELQAAGDQLTDTSRQLGVNAQDLQRWQLAAKLSGAEATDLATGVKILSKNAADAKNAGDFKALGVEVKDSAGQMKDPLKLLGDVGLEIAKIKSPAERTKKALELFGKAGTKLLPMFSEGEEGLAKMLDKLDELGGGLGDDALDILEKSGDATDELGIATLSLKSRLAVQLFPALTQGIGWLTKFIAGFTNTAKGTKIFQSAIVVLGASAAAAGLAAMAPWIPFFLLIGGAIFLVEDLWTAWEGGESAIGMAIDSIFGLGTTEEVIKKIKDAWTGINEAMEKTPTAAGKARAAFDYIADGAEESNIRTLSSFRELYDALRSDEASWSDIGKAWLWALVAPFRDLGSNLWPHFRDGTNAAWKAFDDWATKGFKTAVDFVLGLVNGFKSGTGMLYDAVAGMANGVLAKVKEVWDSHSPSKAAAPIGKSIPQGLTVGQEQGTPALLAATRRMSGMTLDTLNSSMATPSVSYGGASRTVNNGGARIINVDQRNEYRISSTGAEGSREEYIRQAMKDQSDMARDSLLADLETVMPEPA